MIMDGPRRSHRICDRNKRWPFNVQRAHTRQAHGHGFGALQGPLLLTRSQAKVHVPTRLVAPLLERPFVHRSSFGGATGKEQTK